MRISDWSSDVCSSDLIDLHVRVRIRAGSIVDRDRRIRLDAVRGLGRRQRNLAHRHADAVAAADIDLATGRERLAHVGRQLVGLVEDVLGHCVHRRYLEGTAKGMNAYDACTSQARSEEHTSELQSLMRISYAAFCWKKNK